MPSQCFNTKKLLIYFAFLLSSPVIAQDKDISNVEIEQLFELEEVIITAQRRTENLQDVPISVTAFDSVTLDTFDLNNIYEIEALTPGFSASSFSLGQPQLYIRGIGSNEDSVGGDASVAIYLDGVYITRPSASIFTFNDIERIEVLRGPQGTLYGRNATGGAINIISFKPHDKYETNLELTAGDFNKQRAKLKTNLPFSNNIYSSFAFIIDKQDGYVENLTTGNKIQDINDKSAKWQTLFALTDNTELILALDIDDIDRKGNARRASGSNATLSNISMNYPDDVHKTTANVDGYQKKDSAGIRIELNSQISQIHLTSITAYRDSNYKWLEDLSGARPDQALAAGATDLNNAVDEDSKQASQEVRFSYNEGGFVDWITGIYFLNEKSRRAEAFEYFIVQGYPSPFSFLIENPFSGVSPDPALAAALNLPAGSLYTDLNNDGIADLNDFAMYWGPDPSITDSFHQKINATSIALFGQSAFHFSDKTTLTLGLRYSDEKKKFSNKATTTNTGFVDFLVQENYNIREEESWDTITWRMALEYQWLENISSYLSIDKGFKSGGFQGQSANADVAAKPFDPEYARSIELGTKSLWLDKRLRLNLTFYQTDYTDMQVLQSISSGTARALVTENAGEATTRGVELDYQFQILPQWRVGGSYAYNDGEFDELEIQTANNETVDLSGNKLRNAPKNNFSFMSEYSWYLPNNSEIMYALMYSYRDDTYQDLFNYALNKFPSRELVDSSINWISSNEQISVSAWVKNLTDEEYPIHSFDDSDGEIAVAVYGPPRQYGVSVNLHF